MNNNNRGATPLEKMQFASLNAAAFLTGLAGLALCFTHRVFGLASFLLFTAAGLAGIWMILRTIGSVLRTLDKAGVVIKVGTKKPQVTSGIPVGSASTAGNVPVAGADDEPQRKWQTQVAADIVGDSVTTKKPEPRLGIPRTRQAPARIGGEWDD